MRALSSPFELFKNKLQFEYYVLYMAYWHSTMYIVTYLLTYSHQQQLTSRPVQKLEQRHTILLYQKHQDSLSFPILSSCQLILLPSHHLLLLQRPREKAEEDSKAFTIKSTFLRPSVHMGRCPTDGSY